MRNFLILLLLLNLAYLALNKGLPGERQASSSLKQSRVVQQEASSLELLSELSADTVLVRNDEIIEELEESTPVLPALPELPSPQYCVSLGAFADEEAGDSAVLELSKLGYGATSALVGVEDGLSYWVHMPPFNSSSAVNQRLAEIQEKGIDSFLIVDGVLAQGISLGLFRQEDRALVLQAQIAAKGYPSSIYERMRSHEEVWVSINGLLQPDLVDVRALVLLKEQSELKLEEKLCETIAPEL